MPSSLTKYFKKVTLQARKQTQNRTQMEVSGAIVVITGSGVPLLVWII